MTQPRNPGRPSQALVVLSSGPVAVLESALHAIVPACRSAEIAVIVVRTRQPGDSPLPPEAEAGVDLILASPQSSLREQRRQALARTNADIVTFVDDYRALTFPWSDLLLQRAGLVRPAGTTAPAGAAH